MSRSALVVTDDIAQLARWTDWLDRAGFGYLDAGSGPEPVFASVTGLSVPATTLGSVAVGSPGVDDPKRPRWHVLEILTPGRSTLTRNLSPSGLPRPLAMS